MIIERFRSIPAYSRLVENLPEPGEVCPISNLPGSSSIVLAAALVESDIGRPLIVVTPNARAAEEVEADFDALLPGRGVFFPQRESVHPDLEDPHIEISARRVEAVQALLAGRTRLLVTTGRALAERFALPAHWSELELCVATGQKLDRDVLIARLERSGYRRESLVESVGDYAIRGGIVDLYPITTLDPVRLEFWGDRIESIRSFDALDQRSIEKLEQVRILPIHFPGGEAEEPDGQLGSLIDVLPESALVLRTDPQAEDEDRRRGWSELARRTERPEVYQHAPDATATGFSSFGRLEVTEAAESTGPAIDFGALPPAEIDRRIDRLIAQLREAAGRGGQVLILCDNDGQAQRLEEILEETVEPTVRAAVTVGLQPLAGGFTLPDAEPPLWLLTDHEIFRRARRPRRRPRSVSREALESLSSLTPGDYVVHMDHGIGRYRGLERVEVGDDELETLVIEYAGGDVLRVPHYRAELVERWRGDLDPDSARAPKLHQLGGKSWQRLKKRTRESIQTMAAELLELYAARRLADGHAFGPDTRWQREMESAFIYEDTPDQEMVTQEIKRDMETPRPMDRLICGDVGFGKTELAIRAAFKAVQDGAQVAVLAPTTVLAEQHLDTFGARLAEYPVRVEALSRFRTAAEQREVVKGVADGSIDIVIGTHRLLSEDVRFKKLGLLIIDEEQNFGVQQKERLKDLRRSVDVLTMTATPIPRTLHLSLSGLRDRSLIKTPPRDRQPIITHMMTWDDRTLEDAIRLEVDRGGQVFFVHNRVESIEGVAAKVRRLVPELRVEIGHGQMPERNLEKVMTDFVRGDIDVLVSTAIVENGLDVPNANTMIVHRADYFGLAQLYQLRGRVGRSHQRAFCYLVVPPNLAPETEQRLLLLEKHTELGAGYRLALRDLELRGAGNLLGSEQSGFAQAVGFDTYLRLLESTVSAMQGGEAEAGRQPAPDVSVSGASYVPDGYIADESLKLEFYRRLSKVTRLAELDSLTSEMRDRFGRFPPEVESLIASSRIRILGSALGIERVLDTGGSARINFRRGVIPRLKALRKGLSDREVEVEVGRLQPLSLVFKTPGPERVTPILIEALERLADEETELATAG